MERFGRVVVLALWSFILSGAGFSACAWDSPGHMAVAGLAYDELTPAEQTKLVAILKQHRDLSRFKTDLKETTLKSRDLVMAAATWPDLIKDDTNNYTNNGYDEKGPITAVTDDHKMHKGWHFIDTPLQRDSTTPTVKTPDANTVDAVTVLHVLLTQLGSNESDPKKAFDLCWLLHLTGDLHQPLHCVTGIDVTYPGGDTGGNDIRLTGETHTNSELHAYWDNVLGKSAGHDKTTHRALLDKDLKTANAIVASLSGVSLPPNASDITPEDWANDCVNLAKHDAYHFAEVTLASATVHGKNVTREKVTLDGPYFDTASSVAQTQVKLAGHRLALLLKPILDH